MAVPEHIRKVERPVNTIVQDSGRDGAKRYVVRERKKVNYIKGGNPQPVNGKTIGYIVNQKFVPIQEKTALNGPDVLSYGTCALAKALSKDIVEDLLAVYPANDVYTIMALATLKVTRPGISAGRISSAYEKNYVRIDYPGAAMSKNSIGSLYQKLGMDGQKRSSFYEKRISRTAADHHIIIDGTLKQDTSHMNDLSAYSYKARLKGCEDISVIYAYDLERMEPLCAQVFPGNCIDAVAYRSFVKDNNIRNGIIISDKGFPPNNIRDVLAENDNLHYMTPMKRNDRRIASQNLLNFDGVLPGIEKTVQFSKRKLRDDLYLYAYRDSSKASREERSYLQKIKENQEYSHESYAEMNRKFGLIIFESDIDMEPLTAFRCYEDRWQLELVFKAYKSDDCFDRTNVQGDFSVIGCEFVNFISTVITRRIIARAERAELLREMTYGELLEDLNTAWRSTDAPAGIPRSDDTYWVHTIPKVMTLLEKLELSEPAAKPEPKKPGRKKGSVNKKKESEETLKRPVGRPRKNPPVDPNAPKRSVGRPRVNPLPDPDTPKRKVGRPRVRPLPDPDAPKRPVGRPRKQAGTEEKSSS